MKSKALRTARLELVVPRPQDAVEIAAACSTPEIARMINRPEGYSLEDAIDYVHAAVEDWAADRRYVFAILLDGIFIGQVSLDRKGTQDSAVIGYWLDPAYQGKGYLSEAGRTVLSWALDPEALGLQRVLWHAYMTNRRSIKLAQALGFRLLGTKERGELTWNSRGPAYHAHIRHDESQVPQHWLLH